MSCITVYNSITDQSHKLKGAISTILHDVTLEGSKILPSLLNKFRQLSL